MSQGIQFSGGKDSLAVVCLFQDILEDFTVYWANPGDPFPETMRIVDYVRGLAPNFVEINSDVKSWHELFGPPVDIVPSQCTPLGILSSSRAPKRSDRFSCCWNNIMKPLHEKMMADGVDIILRGVKECDAYRSGITPGETVDGITYLYPIWDWSDADVIEFLKDSGAPIADYYANGKTEGMDCRCCTAWWDKGHSAYTRVAAPDQWVKNTEILRETREIVGLCMNNLDAELKGV